MPCSKFIGYLCHISDVFIASQLLETLNRIASSWEVWTILSFSLYTPLVHRIRLVQHIFQVIAPVFFWPTLPSSWFIVLRSFFARYNLQLLMYRSLKFGYGHVLSVIHFSLYLSQHVDFNIKKCQRSSIGTLIAFISLACLISWSSAHIVQKVVQHDEESWFHHVRGIQYSIFFQPYDGSFVARIAGYKT